MGRLGLTNAPVVKAPSAVELTGTSRKTGPTIPGLAGPLMLIEVTGSTSETSST